MDPNDAAFDDRGRLVCRLCASTNAVAKANQLIEERDPASTRNLWLGAAGSLAIALGSCFLSLFVGFLFLAAPAAILLGGWTVVHLLRTPETRTQLGGGYWLVMLLSIAGVLLGLATMAFGLLAMAAQGYVRSNAY
jgi:hypothetical protein